MVPIAVARAADAVSLSVACLTALIAVRIVDITARLRSRLTRDCLSLFFDDLGLGNWPSPQCHGRSKYADCVGKNFLSWILYIPLNIQHYHLCNSKIKGSRHLISLMARRLLNWD